MTQLEFRNVLCVLLSIDRDTLVDAGIIRENDSPSWWKFRADPFRWFLAANGMQTAALWSILSKRLTGGRRGVSDG